AIYANCGYLDRWAAPGQSAVRRMALFFLQAEDGIRDSSVTGVQTCALPISASRTARARTHPADRQPPSRSTPPGHDDAPPRAAQIGRASCRERVGVAGVGGC